MADELSRSLPRRGSAPAPSASRAAPASVLVQGTSGCSCRAGGSGAGGAGWSCPAKEPSTPAMQPFRSRIRPLRALRGWLCARCCASLRTDKAPARAVPPSLCPTAPAGVSPHPSWMWQPALCSPGWEQHAGDKGCPRSPSLGWGHKPAWWLRVLPVGATSPALSRRKTTGKGAASGRQCLSPGCGGWRVPWRDGHCAATAAGTFNLSVKALSRADLFCSLRAAPYV